MKINGTILLLILLISGCEDNKGDDTMIDKQNLIGYWINIVDSNDTLVFQDSIILRSYFGSSKPRNVYEYELHSDSIRLHYIGPFYVLVPDLSFRITLDELSKTLTITNLSGYYPYITGDEFKYLSE